MQVLAHNLAAQFTSRQLTMTTDKKTKSSEKLASGYKINRSADDAAGLQISEKMRSQIRGLNQDSENIQDGISLCQVADGALNESHAVLQRMRELSVQAANDTNSDEDRNAIQQEIDQLTKEVDRIANDTSFNEEIYPLKGTGLSGNDLSGKIGLSLANLSLRVNNLKPYTYTTSKGQEFIDLKFKLLPSTSKLQICTLNGTVIYEEYATDGLDKVKNNYEIGDHRYYSSLSAPNSYFTSGGATFGFWNQTSVTNAEVNEWLNHTIFTYWIENDNSMVHATTQRDNNSNTSNNNFKQIWIQMGAQKDQGMFLNLVNATAKGVGITDPALDVTNYANASTSISRLDDAISKVSSYRSSFGAQQNRLEHGKLVDDNTAENTQNAELRIRDVDMANEMVEYSKNNILEQVGQAMLAQANQNTQNILSLLN